MLHSRATTKFAANPTVRSRRCVVVRASSSGSSNRWQQAASVVLSTGLAASMLLAVPAPAQAVLSEAQRAEQEATILKQKEQLEFALQLQENARKAALVGRQQQLESTVNQVETAIQRKLIEEEANKQAAAAKGLAERAARIEAEAAQVKAQEAAVQVAAAKAEAALGQAKIVEQAREVEEQQSVDKAATSIMDMLGLSPADLGL